MPVFYSQHIDIILSASSVSLLLAGIICLRIAKEKSLKRRLPSWRYLGIGMIVLGLRNWLFFIGILGILGHEFVNLHVCSGVMKAIAALFLILAARVEAGTDEVLAKLLRLLAVLIIALALFFVTDPLFYANQLTATESLFSNPPYFLINCLYTVAAAIFARCAWKSPVPPDKSVNYTLALILAHAILMTATPLPGIPGVHRVTSDSWNNLLLAAYITRVGIILAATILMWNQYTAAIGITGPIRWRPLILIFFCFFLAVAFFFISALDTSIFKRLVLLSFPHMFVFFLIIFSGQQRAWLASHSNSRIEALRQGALGNELTGVMITRSNIIVDTNRRCCDLLGIPAEQLAGKNVSVIFSGEGNNPLGVEVKKAIREKGRHLFELPLYTPDNRIVHLLVFARKLSDDPLDSHYIWEAVDITRQKEMENAAKSGRDYLQMIIDTLRVGVFVRDAGDTYQLVNRAFVELMGFYRMEDVLGKTPFDILSLDVDAFRNYEAMCVNMDGGTLVYEQPLAIDNQQKVYEISKAVKWWGRHRDRFLVIGSVHDFAPRLKTREAAQWIHSFFQQIADVLPCAMCFQDRDGILRLCSKKFCEEIGAESPERLIGNPYSMIAPFGQVDEDVDRALLRRGGFEEVGFEYARDGMIRRYRMVRIAAISSEGESLGVVKVFWEKLG